MLLTSFVVVSLGTALALAAACSQSSNPAQDPGGSDGVGTSLPAPNGSTPSNAMASAPTPATGTAPVAAIPGGECVNVPENTPDIPDGGVAMSNAQTAGDAGSSDRLVPVMDVVTKNRDKYRCCFDLWGRKNAGKDGKVTLTIKLKETGELESAAFKPDETDVADKDVEGCMENVTKSLSFPASPSGKVTRYNHRFNFKAHSP